MSSVKNMVSSHLVESVQQARKERFMLQDSVEKYYSFVFPVKAQQDSGVCYRHRSASEVFNVACGFALHIFQPCNQKLSSVDPKSHKHTLAKAYTV